MPKSDENEKPAEEAEQQSQPVDMVVPPEMMGEPAEPPLPDKLPIIPLRGVVVFPGTVAPLGVGRTSSRALLDQTLPETKVIGVVAQHDADVEDPTPDDLYEVGTAVTVLKLIREDDDTISLLIHGMTRFRVTGYDQTEPFFVANIEPVQEQLEVGADLEAAVKNLRETAIDLVESTPNAPEQIRTILANIDEPSSLADFVAANLALEVEERQRLLEETDVARRIRTTQVHVSQQLEIARLQQKIQEDVQSEISDVQRRAYLREQLKAIQKELGISGDGTDEQIMELRDKLETAGPPEAVMKEAERELNRLNAIPTASPEYSVILTYLETIAELPWNVASEDDLDLKRARKILDRDHFDLDKVKKRLIEYLAVRKLNPDGRGPILCLVGPPGVGKTSLGQSVADALGREFSRMSLGGIRDEAEVRGHRRTYIGAMPGRIIQEMRRVGKNNPVMMLDEIDKLGSDFRGDPASALLEVLDPRQNDSFVDRYLDVPFDLSQVIFIATANYMDPVPHALRDRMEVIEIAGYTEREKLEIAQRYLVPRQLEENGLKKSWCVFNKTALRKIISDYTREAGVRNLERQVGAICRGVAAQIAADEIEKARVNVDLVRELLGPEQHVRELRDSSGLPGVVTGLAYTPTGGEVLFIEATKYPGKGEVQLTGQLGDVMKESMHAAMSLLKSRAGKLGLSKDDFENVDIHVHVPAGAVPKDGPSAGVSMFTALTSLFLDKPVPPDVAMTGEVTLRGLVLPIGGLKEKSLAAMRAGIKTVIAPKRNEKDMPDVTEEAKEKLKFVFVENVDDLLREAIGI